MFISFANFYKRFIQDFSKIAALLTFLLKSNRSSKWAPKVFKANDNEVVSDDDSRADRTVINLFINEKSKKLTPFPNIGATKEPKILTLNGRNTFNYLWLAFIKALILQYFDLKSHNRIEIDTLGYIIGKLMSQFNLNFNVSPNDLNESDFVDSII